MLKLLRSNLTRIIKSPTFWICSAIYLIYGIIIAICGIVDQILGNELLYNVGFCGSPLTGYLILTFISIIIGADFNNKTIHNKILIGHSKSKIYLSNVLAFSICAIVLNLVFLCITIPTSRSIAVICLIDAIFNERSYDLIAKIILLTVLYNIVSVTFYVSLYTLIIMNIKNTVASIICGLALNVVAIFFTWGFLACSNEEWFGWVYILMYMQPVGLDALIANGDIIMLGAESPLFFIFTTALLVILIAITTKIGIAIFNKSNIK